MIAETAPQDRRFSHAPDGADHQGMTALYTPAFFANHADGAHRSATRILPIVMDLVHPTSVVDVGCAEGTWLAAWRDLDVPRLIGLDGEYVDRHRLRIEPDTFTPFDLSTLADDGAADALVARAGQRFDLAMSLEVAEHLPEQAAASLVGTLCRLAPVVLFSAAVPYQGGTGHLTERLPSFWASLFSARNYRAVDAIRAQIWDDRSVEWWYRQNTLLFASDDALAVNAPLREARARTSDHALDLIHPAHYRRVVRWAIEGGRSESDPHALAHIQQLSPIATSESPLTL